MAVGSDLARTKFYIKVYCVMIIAFHAIGAEGQSSFFQISIDVPVETVRSPVQILLRLNPVSRSQPRQSTPPQSQRQTSRPSRPNIFPSSDNSVIPPPPPPPPQPPRCRPGQQLVVNNRGRSVCARIGGWVHTYLMKQMFRFTIVRAKYFF
jgi:hypothetical protein